MRNLNNSKFFNDDMVSNEKENIVGGIKMEDKKFRMTDIMERKMRRVINLKKCVTEFLGLTQILHSKLYIRLYSVNMEEINDVMSMLRITENDISSVYRDYREADSSILLSVYEDRFRIISNEINRDEVFTAMECLVLSEFKEKAYKFYLEASQK